MRMGRASMVVLAGLAVLFAGACSSGGGDDDADDDDVTSTATRPARTRTPEGTATPEKAKAPTFTPGKWTAGEAEAAVSGGASITVKGTLNNQASSDKDTTRLIFVAGTDTIAISISTVYQPFAMTVYKEPVDAQSSPDSPCVVTYSKTEDKAIAGSFRCEKARLNRGLGEALIEGTFSATR